MNVCYPITSGKQEIPRSTCFSDRTENQLPGKQQPITAGGGRVRPDRNRPPEPTQNSKHFGAWKI